MILNKHFDGVLSLLPLIGSLFLHKVIKSNCSTNSVNHNQILIN